MDIDIKAMYEARHAVSQMGGRDIFAKAKTFQFLIKTAREIGIYPYYHALERNDGPVAIFRGQEVIMLGSNNYLGLTTHPKVKEAAIDAINNYGTSMTGSRFLNGTIELHEQFESELAQFVGKESALIFSTGYQANVGILSGLANSNTVIISDKKNHASLSDGIKVSEGRHHEFNHNDINDFRMALNSIDEDEGAFVVVDGVFSMEGDIINLPKIVEYAKKAEARILVDDAHGLGVLGKKGQGTAHHFGLENEVDLIMGTFSKSFASIGGYVAGDAEVIDYIRIFGRTIIFSAALPPANAAAARACLHILQEEPERVLKLKENANFLRKGLKDIGFQVHDGETAIVPIIIGNDVTCIRFWKDLLENGVYTNPVIYPAVGKNKATIRTSVMATHDEKQLSQALETFERIAKKSGLLDSIKKDMEARRA